MKKLSTGQNSTLGVYLTYTRALFGEESKAFKFLQDKIKSSPNGEDEEVLVDENQMIQLLVQLDSRL